MVLINFISKARQVVLIGSDRAAKETEDVFLSIPASLDSLRSQEVFGLALGFKL